MAKPRVPKYCRHKGTGQAYSTWPAGTPNAGKPRYFGVHNSAESHEAYRRWIAELPLIAPIVAGARERATVAELCARWLKWVDSTGLYRKHGKPTGGLWGFVTAIGWVCRSHAALAASDFGPYELSQLRDAMISRGLAQRTINGYVDRLKQIFARGATWGIVSRDAWVGLSAVRPLKGAEGGVPPKKVLGADEAALAAVLKRVTPQVGAILQLCSLSACRTGEARILRTADVRKEDPRIPKELVGLCWVYQPTAHKEEHRGEPRIILLGPQAQAIVSPWLDYDRPERFVWRPADALVASNRKHHTKHGRRAGSTGRHKRDSERPYSHAAIWRAVTEACKAAKVPHWHPHALRHLAATRLARTHGVEVARTLLGHADTSSTEIYLDPGTLPVEELARYAAAVKAIIEHG